MSRLKSLSYFLFDISHLLNINYDNNLHSNMFLLIPNFSIWSVISKLNLHSTMFLLIQPFLCPQESVRLYLHSTMFLLIHYHAPKKCMTYHNLHSTMFLLIQKDIQHIKKKIALFTFHNVSINFLMRTMWMIHHLYLHSTMFLLIHGIPEDFVELYLYLHSTMFLLIHPTGTGTIFPAFEFTFHNVSINSFIIFVKNAIIFSFTFHNVSINSVKNLLLIMP